MRESGLAGCDRVREVTPTLVRVGAEEPSSAATRHPAKVKLFPEAVYMGRAARASRSSILPPQVLSLDFVPASV
ncbi:MAG: hypothetical protein M1358_06210 [Chloroflexi bacterium]|nr:hypothetical protein [Chloroflexota bacterium]